MISRAYIHSAALTLYTTRTVTFRGRLQHIHPEEPLKKMAPLSGMVQSLRRGLNRATLGVFVIDEDRCPCVEVLPDLEDFGRQRDVLDAVVGAFAVG